MTTCQENKKTMIWENFSNETYILPYNVVDGLQRPETKAFICLQKC
jgi:hypothetical protein